jgi:glycerol-3-phosphate O-acyltransferase
MDDEFSEPRTIANFVRRILALDAAVHVVYGEPMDVLGNSIDENNRSLDPRGNFIDRRGYLSALGNRVEDEQRDHLYTERLASQLSKAYARDFVAQPTHLVAWAAWEALREAHRGLDTWRLVRLHPDQAVVERVAVLRRVESALEGLKGRRSALSGGPAQIVDEAVSRFAGFHRKKALQAVGPLFRLSPELCLYYRNRMVAWPEFR